MTLPRRAYLASLGLVFAAVWLLLAIHPHDRSDWLLENLLLVVFAAALAASHRALPLSRISYTLIWLFLLLHTVGAHYTYSLVPWADGLRALGLPAPEPGSRNHFDRIVHLAYGLLLAYPIREVFLRVAGLRGFWGYFFPFDVTLSTSVVYELIEWASAEIFGGDLGVAFLGTQGDVWDAQKDMALAGLGALLAMLLTAALNHALDRDFAREWVQSLRVKQSAPLGEDEIARLLRERQADEVREAAANEAPAAVAAARRERT
jgi:putative membrane protein